MSGVARGTDGGDQFDILELFSNRQNCCTAQAVPDQKVDGQAICFQRDYCRAKIFQVGRKIRIGEITFALPKSSKIKPEHRKALVSQSF